MHQTAVTLNNPVLVKPASNKVAVHIRRVNEIVVRYFERRFIAIMRFRLGVQVKTMAVKEPELLRIAVEKLWICGLCKCHFSFFEVGVCFPKTFSASKRWKT